MTTPVQRMRSLRWGLELLNLMQVDQAVPATLRRLAAELLPSYPTQEVLNGLLATRTKLLPRPVADAIEAAGRLFVELDRSGFGTDGTRRHLMFTLRHYPLPGDPVFWATFDALDGVAEWLECEDPLTAHD